MSKPSGCCLNSPGNKIGAPKGLFDQGFFFFQILISWFPWFSWFLELLEFIIPLAIKCFEYAKSPRASNLAKSNKLHIQKISWATELEKNACPTDILGDRFRARKNADPKKNRHVGSVRGCVGQREGQAPTPGQAEEDR